MPFLKLNRILLGVIMLLAVVNQAFAQPGPPPTPDDVPISNLAVLLILLAKGLGIYKIYQSKRKK